MRRDGQCPARSSVTVSQLYPTIPAPRIRPPSRERIVRVNPALSCRGVFVIRETIFSPTRSGYRQLPGLTSGDWRTAAFHEFRGDAQSTCGASCRGRRIVRNFPDAPVRLGPTRNRPLADMFGVWKCISL